MCLSVVAAVCEVYVFVGEVYIFVDYIPVSAAVGGIYFNIVIAAAVCGIYFFVGELYILFYSCVCICVAAAVCEVYILFYSCVAAIGGIYIPFAAIGGIYISVAAIGDQCPVGSLRITAEFESKSQSSCDEQSHQCRSHAQKPPPRLPAGSQ